jgi:hypothetical protein
MYAYFTVPAGFHALPIGMTPGEAYAYVGERLPQDAGESAAREVHGLSQALRGAGAMYAGASARLVGDEPSVATLLVTVQEFPYGDNARVAAEGTMQALVASRGQGWTGGVYDLPCGSAAVVMGGRTQPLPPPPEEDPDQPASPPEIPWAELQAFVPVPEHPSLPQQCTLTVTFGTPSLGHWEGTYMPLLVKLLRSVEFTSLEQEATS